MYYTQVELGLGDSREVWWLPVPEDRARVGERIDYNGGEWEITQVCLTLKEEYLRQYLPDANIARKFERTAQTIAYMTM